MAGKAAVRDAPTSWLFQPGHGMRVLVINSIPGKSYGMDLFNSTPRLSPAPTVTILRDREHVSFITLPIVGDIQSSIKQWAMLLKADIIALSILKTL